MGYPILTTNVKDESMSTELVPADQYTIEALTEAYNRTRVNYLVPMPMDPAKLRDYLHLYQIDLGESLVAVEEGIPVGLGMLGVRANRSWVTRLGVVASHRGKGTGRKILAGLLANSDRLGIEKNKLEVIKGNAPAYHLFQTAGFRDLRELLILQRDAGEASHPKTQALAMGRAECLACLEGREEELAWTNETESLAQMEALQGFRMALAGGATGWMVFRVTHRLTHLMFGTQGDEQIAVMAELLAHLHVQYPDLAAYTENIPVDDPRLPVFRQFGYSEAFRRIEMRRTPFA